MGIKGDDGGLIKRQAFKEKKTKELAPISDNPLREEGYALDDDEKKIVKDYFTKMRYGPLMSDAILCKGHACEYAKMCPLMKINKLPPHDTPCPVEHALAKQWASDLASELEVDPASVIDNAQVQSIVANQLFLKRAKEILAQSSPVIKVFKSVALDGTPIYEPRLHPLLQALRDVHAMNERDLESLIATREAKSKDDSRAVDAATRMAEVIEKVENLVDGEVMGIKNKTRGMLQDLKGPDKEE